MDSKKDGQATYHHGNLREELLERAIAAIAEGGVASVSLRALARDIGVSHAAPIRHFPTRTDLLATIAREGVEALLRSATLQTKGEGLTGLDKLRAMARGYVGWARDHPVHHLVLRNRDVMQHADESLIVLLRGYAQLQQETIAQAQKEGWRTDEPSRIILLQIVGLTAGLALVATDPLYEVALKARPRKKDLQEAIDVFFS